MVDLYDLNLDAVDPFEDFAPVPAGKYLAEITKTTQKNTRAGNGWYLEIEFTITNGEFAGRKIWDRLNLRNPSQQAEQIALRKLKSIVVACGLQSVSDSEELHGIAIVLDVGLEARNDDPQKMTNRVRSVLPYNQQTRRPAPQQRSQRPQANHQPQQYSAPAQAPQTPPAPQGNWNPNPNPQPPAQSNYGIDPNDDVPF